MINPQIWKFPADLPVQEGKVSQQLLIKKEPGMVIAFAFAAGQELREHTAPYDVLVSILSGVAELRVNAQTMIFSQGSCILIPANVPHTVRSETDMHMTLTMIRA